MHRLAGNLHLVVRFVSSSNGERTEEVQTVAVRLDIELVLGQLDLPDLEGGKGKRTYRRRPCDLTLFVKVQVVTQ